MRHLALVLILFSVGINLASARAADETDQSSCRVEPTTYRGWSAQQLSNRWLKLEIVPQNGGRLMQVIFAGHPFLFVNPEYEGKYLPPSQSHWFNYGGDKLWLLPEGNEDEKHWVGNSDLIDDSPYTFRKISEGSACEIELTSPVDPQTGVQIRRTIHLDADSPAIHFHATMQNKSGHPIEWSFQSVSQYDTSNSANPSQQNRNFWTFTPANPASSYLKRYYVQFGPAENAAVSVREDGLFALHYAHLAAELWIDSTPGWLAVVDGDSKYAMVERFRYEKKESYPGNASVIFWMNGPELRMGADGVPTVGSADPIKSPYYLEAELNSPLADMQPGETRDLDTEWLPTRAGSDFHGVADAGIIVDPLQATRLENGNIRLSGSFGAFFEGRLIANFYDGHGSNLGSQPLMDVSPSALVTLKSDVKPPAAPSRVSLHLQDRNGLDRGSFQEIQILPAESH
jgi:hypothetical protein